MNQPKVTRYLIGIGIAASVLGGASAMAQSTGTASWRAWVERLAARATALNRAKDRTDRGHVTAGSARSQESFATASLAVGGTSPAASPPAPSASEAAPGTTTVDGTTGVAAVAESSAAATIPAPVSAPIAPTLVSASVENALRLRNGTASTATNTPFQFGRAFRQGEITTCPQVTIDGVSTPAQVDVKNRYADGSLKFAVVSMVIPSLAPSVESTVRLFDGGGCAGDPGPTFESILAAFPGFDARITVNGGAGGVASARALLVQGNASVWTAGPVQTTYVVADHRAKQSDLGADEMRSLRPTFQVQVWHQLRLIQVRVNVEQSDTEKVQSQAYAVEVAAGRDALASVYTNAAVSQPYGSRWTKTFWLGGVPAEFDVKHDVAYLSSTKAIPNYDARITLSDAARSKWIAAEARQADIFGEGGVLTRYMPTTGGRPEIGLFPEWMIAALYDGDARLLRLSRRLAELAAAWPIHFREGGSRTFMDGDSSAGSGRVMTVDARPTLFMGDGNGYMNNANFTSDADKIGLAGAIADSGWVADAAHQPEMWYLNYLLTGDFWFLEELQYWAAWSAFQRNPGGACWGAGRSPKDGTIANQIRGEAWILRTRARAAWASPDGSLEARYFRRITDAALRAKEGRTGAAVANDVVSEWWSARCVLAGNPLHYWDEGYDGYLGDLSGMGYADARNGTPPWQIGYLVGALGHLDELGFQSTALLNWAGGFLVGIAAASPEGYLHLADYVIPAQKNVAGSPFFQTWADVFDGGVNWTESWSSSRRDLDSGYANIATAAASFLSRVAPPLWATVEEKNYAAQSWGDDPKWAIRPR